MKIHAKLTLIFFIAFFSVLAFLFFHLHNDLNHLMINNVKQNLKRELLLSRSIISKDGNPANFDEIADLISTSLETRVTIINDKGKVLGDSEKDGKELLEMENHLYRQEIQEALKKGFGKRERYSTTIKQQMLYMVVPLTIQDKLYLVRVAKPIVEINILKQKIQQTMAGAFLTAFLFAICIGIISSYIISKPITRMSVIARNIAKGDYTDHMPRSNSDEIDDLARSLSFMSSQIKKRISEVTVERSKLEAVFLSLFDGIMITDVSGKILLVNDTFKQYFKINTDVSGKSCIEIIRNVAITNLVNDVIRRDLGLVVKEVELLIPEQKNILVHAAAVKRDNKKEGVVLIFHDITEIRKLEQVRKDFVSNVSHELRTPVSKIRAAAETLQDGALEDKKMAKEFSSIIYDDSVRLSELIQDLLELSQIESNVEKIDKENISLKDTIDQALKALSHKTKKKNIQIETDLHNVSTVVANQRYLVVALINLLDNAIKYSEQNSIVRIQTQIKQKYVHISISDNGIGIAQEHMERLFERFYRVDKARSKEMGGTGLGLSIVKHIIKAHGGEVSVASQLSKGTTFSFTLPL